VIVVLKSNDTFTILEIVLRNAGIDVKELQFHSVIKIKHVHYSCRQVTLQTMWAVILNPCYIQLKAFPYRI